MAPNSGGHYLATELKTTMMLLILVGQISLSALISMFFVYSAELLPTILR